MEMKLYLNPSITHKAPIVMKIKDDGVWQQGLSTDDCVLLDRIRNFLLALPTVRVFDSQVTQYVGQDHFHVANRPGNILVTDARTNSPLHAIDTTSNGTFYIIRVMFSPRHQIRHSQLSCINAISLRISDVELYTDYVERCPVIEVKVYRQDFTTSTISRTIMIETQTVTGDMTRPPLEPPVERVITLNQNYGGQYTNANTPYLQHESRPTKRQRTSD